MGARMRNNRSRQRPEVVPSRRKNWIYHRGDVYLANLDPVKGSEQGGVRPVAVLQNDVGNYFSSTIIIVPLTTQLKKIELPTHVLLNRVQGLPHLSMAETEQIHRIDKQRILRYMGKLTENQLKLVEDAAKKSLGMNDIPYSIEAP